MRMRMDSTGRSEVNRSGYGIRFLKDFQDLEGLLVINNIDPNTEKIRQLFIKYGTLDLHEKIVRACSND